MQQQLNQQMANQKQQQDIINAQQQQIEQLTNHIRSQTENKSDSYSSQSPAHGNPNVTSCPFVTPLRAIVPVAQLSTCFSLSFVFSILFRFSPFSSLRSSLFIFLFSGNNAEPSRKLSSLCLMYLQSLTSSLACPCVFCSSFFSQIT